MNDATANASNPTEAGIIPEQFSSTRNLDLNHIEQVRKHVQHWNTQSGTPVWFVPSHELALVDLVLEFKAGRALDGDQPGLSALTLYTLDEGLQTMEAGQFNESLERLGVSFDKRLSTDYVTLSLRTLASEAVLEPAVDLILAMLAQPALSDASVEKIRQQLQALRARTDASPVTRARNEAFRQLFKGHPYANALTPTQAGLDAVTAEEVRAFHARAYSANNVRISMVGDLSRAQADAMAERISQALAQAWAAIDPPPLPVAAPETLHVQAAGVNAAIILAVPQPILRREPLYPALMLANQILGVGLESRLMQALRRERGLTYDVRSTLISLQAGGVLALEWQVAAHYNAASQALVIDLLKQFIDQGPTDAELALARQQLAGKHLREVARNQSLSQLLAQLGRHDLEDDHLSTYVDRLIGVSAQDVRLALQQLDLDAVVAVSVGPTKPQEPLPEPAPLAS
ncbi:M16 family metallopeptidase [Pseudomonas sp. UFMG81]|uniref:M16 family metallopeptidase n=1 Tax=Pseudomonas sp. UFMG81 TaxID=2745936 RepID=UPI0018907DD5|nr:pitrilysin family protein [Pseudomonas sp. UFMG81]